MGKAKSDVEAKFPKGAAPRAALDAALAPLETQMKAESAAVVATFETSLSLLLESFDKVLSATPSIANLPVSVTVVVESSGTRIPLVIQPSESVREVRAQVMARLEAQANPVVSHSERCLFFLQRALGSGREMLNETMPLGALKIEPGSLLLW